jgi:hypothetical protein
MQNKTRAIASLIDQMTNLNSSTDDQFVDGILQLLTEEVEMVAGGGGNSCIDPA